MDPAAAQVPANVSCLQAEVIGIVRGLSAAGALTFSETGRLVDGDWRLRVDVVPDAGCPATMAIVAPKADLIMDILDDAGATISMEEPASCYAFEVEAESPPPSPPPTDESSISNGGAIAGAVVGASLMPLLLLALWMSGAFTNEGCPSPLAKKATPEPTFTSASGIETAEKA